MKISGKVWNLVTYMIKNNKIKPCNKNKEGM